MLNKEVCKRCADRELIGGWTPMCEAQWNVDGDVCCIWVALKSSELFAVIRVDQPPPEQCPYAAEHVVSQDVE